MEHGKRPHLQEYHVRKEIMVHCLQHSCYFATNLKGVLSLREIALEVSAETFMSCSYFTGDEMGGAELQV